MPLYGPGERFPCLTLIVRFASVAPLAGSADSHGPPEVVEGVVVNGTDPPDAVTVTTCGLATVGPDSAVKESGVTGTSSLGAGTVKVTFTGTGTTVAPTANWTLPV